MTNEQYHKHTALGSSDIKLLKAKNPEYLAIKKGLIDGEIPDKTSPAMVMGSAVHTLVLEPHLFDKEYLVLDLASRKNKTYAEATQTHPIGKILLAKEKEDVDEIVKSLKTAIPDEFLSGGIAEHTFMATVKGVEVKCRPDYYIEDLGIIVDLKTATDASPTEFQRSIAKYDYHIQASLYMDIVRQNGKEANSFLFAVVEKQAPYQCAFYDLDHTSIDLGREMYLKQLSKWADCVSTNDFYGYEKRVNGQRELVQTLTLPNWAYYQNEES